MKDTEFKLIDPIAEIINDKFEDLYKSGGFDEILKKIKETVQKLPNSYSLSFDIQLNIFDNNRKKGITILNTGINCNGDIPYRHYGDSATQKYMVEGDMCIVPEDYCPHCWGEWDLKLQQTACPNCKFEMGKQVKLLIDDDICPWCKEGKISIDNPHCGQCKYEIDPRMVIWG